MDSGYPDGTRGGNFGSTMARWTAVLLLAIAAAPGAHAAGRPSPKVASTLAASSSTTTLSGTLTSGGKAVANATVSAYALDVTARTGMMWHEFDGTVPTGTVSAIIGVRAGTDGACICNGAAGASIGGVWYVEPTTGLTRDYSPVSLPVSGAPDSVRTYALTPGQVVSSNLGQFTPGAGKPYSLYVAIGATGNAASAGYVSVIFLNSKGAELRRDKVWFTPAQLSVGSAVTNASGQYSIAVPATVAAVYPEYHLSYAGGSTTLASASVLASNATTAQAAMPALAQQLPTKTQLNGARMAWFTPREDFLGLLASGQTWDQVLTQWSNGAQHVQVISLAAENLLAIPDAALPGILRALDSHGLALALQIQPSNWYNEVSCGGGIESYSDPGTANNVVQKLLNAGGKLSAITMDEPLWYGHYYAGSNACKSSIADEARRAAVIVKIFTAAFPNVIVGDIEPFPELSLQANWQTDYAAWLSAFSAASGAKVAFLQMDFDWDHAALYPYQYASINAITTLAQQVATAARAQGLGIGMICNGNYSASTDSLWATAAQFHMDVIATSGSNPDQLLFQTWVTPPTHTLPESDQTTLSGLLYYYFSRYN
jgi:hypothetical protein